MQNTKLEYYIKEYVKNINHKLDVEKNIDKTEFNLRHINFLKELIIYNLKDMDLKASMIYLLNNIKK